MYCDGTVKGIRCQTCDAHSGADRDLSLLDITACHLVNKSYIPPQSHPKTSNLWFKFQFHTYTATQYLQLHH
jgi:hypothetical protein